MENKYYPMKSVRIYVILGNAVLNSNLRVADEFSSAPGRRGSF